jgi:hypothetical protein
MPPAAINDYAGLALAFARALADGHAATAYAMTSADYPSHPFSKRLASPGTRQHDQYRKTRQLLLG